MTISSTVTKVNYNGNGSAVSFAVTFKYLLRSDIVVTLIVDATGVETVQILNTDYTLTAPADTGTVVMTVAPASGETLVIERIVPFTQTTNYVENDSFPAESHEEALDKATMLVQQVQSLVDRTPQLTIATLLAGLSIEEPVADKGLVYNATGDGIINGGDAADIAAAGANATAAAASAAAAAVSETNAATSETNAAATAAALLTGKGADVASATALPLVNDGDAFDVTGAVTITSFVSLEVGKTFKLHFDAALTLTHHATNLILPGNINILTVAGDEAIFIEYASGTFRCLNYQRSSNVIQVEEFVIKSADESVTSSDTLQDDDELQVTLLANATYEIEFFIWWASASATPDVKFAFIEADGTYILCGVTSAGGNGGSIVGTDNTASPTSLVIGAASESFMNAKVLAFPAGAGGLWKVQWAQNISDATATICKAGSWIKARRID